MLAYDQFLSVVKELPKKFELFIQQMSQRKKLLLAIATEASWFVYKKEKMKVMKAIIRELPTFVQGRQKRIAEEGLRQQEELKRECEFAIKEMQIRKQNQIEENYFREESIEETSIGYAVLPKLVIQASQKIKSLPGRISKRTHVYGGAARDQALAIKRTYNIHMPLDIDMRIGLSLQTVAPILKEDFELKEEPKEEHGVLKVPFTIVENGISRKALLSVSHSPHLAREDLSYIEALRQDNLTFDFIQNAFIISLPRKGEVCRLLYPLNECEIYFATQLYRENGGLDCIRKARKSSKHSESLLQVSCPALIIIDKGPFYQVYYHAPFCSSYNHALPLFIIKPRKIDPALLQTDSYGRLILTPLNQEWAFDIIQKTEGSYRHYHFEEFNRLKNGIAARIAALNQIETILDPEFSFSSDALRFLRLVYQTTSCGYKQVSQKLISAISTQKQVYIQFINTNPGKVNSWMCKLFCREGKLSALKNFQNLDTLGLLEPSFPGLMFTLNYDRRLKSWLYDELSKFTYDPAPSLNYLYAVFVLCLEGLHSELTGKDYILSNPLLRCNFKKVPHQSHLILAKENLAQFISEQQRIEEGKGSYSLPKTTQTVFYRYTPPEKIDPPMNNTHQKKARPLRVGGYTYSSSTKGN